MSSLTINTTEFAAQWGVEPAAADPMLVHTWVFWLHQEPITMASQAVAIAYADMQLDDAPISEGAASLYTVAGGVTWAEAVATVERSVANHPQYGFKYAVLEP